jgi:serine/threonine protein kinase
MISPSAPNPATVPPENLGAYLIVRMLADGASCLCLSEGGRHVVLKRLEADCLLRGELHPSIKERLQRVRELAQKHVATLQTVERIDGSAYLVWEYVDGQTFDDYAAAPQRTPMQLAQLARELLLCIESLHAQGIVHGAIHGRNVIVDSAGRISLTHVSPLLYTDPADDAEAAIHLLREVVSRHPTDPSSLSEWVAQADPARMTLRQLAARLAGAGDAAAAAPTDGTKPPEPRLRRRTLFAAAATALAGIVIAVVVYFTFAHHPPAPSAGFEPLDAVSSAK